MRRHGDALFQALHHLGRADGSDIGCQRQSRRSCKRGAIRRPVVRGRSSGGSVQGVQKADASQAENWQIDGSVRRLAEDQQALLAKGFLKFLTQSIRSGQKGTLCNLFFS